MHVLNVIYLGVKLIEIIFTEKGKFYCIFISVQENHCRSSNMAEAGPDAEAAAESQEARL